MAYTLEEFVPISILAIQACQLQHSKDNRTRARLGKRLYKGTQPSNCENNSIETATELTEVNGLFFLMQLFADIVMALTSVEMWNGESHNP